MNYGYQFDSGQSTTSSITSLVIYIITVVALWRVFTKAGQPGWLAIIPIVNVIVLIRLSGHSGWFVLVIWIPVIGWIISIIFSVDLARAFGKGGVFAFFGLWLFSLIGYLILAFDSSTYRDPRDVALRV